MKKIAIWVLLVAMILSCVGCDTNEETPENMKEVVFLNSLPCIETTILETEDVGKLEQQVIVDSDGTTTNWFGKYIQTDADTLYAFCINVNESAEATLQKLTEKGCHIISDYPYTYTYEGDQAIEPKVTTDLYKKGTVAIAATIEELARLQEDAETDFYVTEAFRSDLVELFEETGWKADSDSSLEEWSRIHNEDLLDKLGDESQITKGVLVDPLAYEGVVKDTEEVKEPKEIVSKEVVFMNRVGSSMILDTYDMPVLKKLKVASEYNYEYDEQLNKDTLYAFKCSFYTRRDVEEYPDYIYEDDGIYVLVEYQGDVTKDERSAIIVCTMNDLVRVFDNEEFTSKWAIDIHPVLRPDFYDAITELGWNESTSVSTWCKDNQELLESKFGSVNQSTMTVELEQQLKRANRDDEISKIIINQTTADGRYYKEFVLADDITNIKNILSDAVGEEIQEEMEPTGGRTFGVILYNSNDELVVSSYSDTVIEVGRKYYSVSDSNWVSKILEYYEMSEIVENELK